MLWRPDRDQLSRAFAAATRATTGRELHAEAARFEVAHCLVADAWRVVTYGEVEDARAVLRGEIELKACVRALRLAGKIVSEVA